MMGLASVLHGRPSEPKVFRQNFIALNCRVERKKQRVGLSRNWRQHFGISSAAFSRRNAVDPHCMSVMTEHYSAVVSIQFNPLSLTVPVKGDLRLMDSLLP